MCPQAEAGAAGGVLHWPSVGARLAGVATWASLVSTVLTPIKCREVKSSICRAFTNNHHQVTVFFDLEKA